MRSTRIRRVGRGAAAAGVATFAALLSHVSAGGAMPGPLGVLVPFVLALFVCTLLAGRTWGLVRLSAAIGISQLFFHGLFVLGAGGTGSMSMGHQHDMTMVMPAGDSATIAALTADGTMWAMHAVAAALTVLAFRFGDRILASARRTADDVIAWFRARWRIPATPIPVRRRSLSVRGTAWIVRTDPRAAVLPSRAPPALVVS